VNDRGVGKSDVLIRDANRRTGPVLLIIALFVNLLTVPIGIALWETVFDEGNTTAAFGFIFPLIGLLALVWAGLKIIRLIVHGSTTFEVAGGKGVLGGKLTGIVRNGRKALPYHTLVARLRCKRKVTTGSGESGSTQVTTIWEGKQEIGAEQSSLRQGVPIELEIPGFLPESDDSDSNSIVLWELMITAPAKPVGLAAEFHVPILREPT
jgi:hypothetical protein